MKTNKHWKSFGGILAVLLCASMEIQAQVRPGRRRRWVWRRGFGGFGGFGGFNNVSRNNNGSATSRAI